MTFTRNVSALVTLLALAFAQQELQETSDIQPRFQEGFLQHGDSIPPHKRKAHTPAKQAKAAYQTAKQAARLANKVAAHSIKVTGHAKKALKHALGALHDARVENQGLASHQKESLKKAEAHLREATKKSDFGKLKRYRDAQDLQREEMEKRLGKNGRMCERDQMRQEIKELRKTLRHKNIHDRDIHEALTELEADLKKSPCSVDDESKAEMEHLRTLVNSLDAAPATAAPSTTIQIPLQAVPFKHRVRICNAYPAVAGLDVFKGHDVTTEGSIDTFRSQQKLTQMPLDYKMCGDFASPLVAGDRLKFTLGGASAGTFTISDLPNNDAVLLIVIHRHDTLSNAVAFKSHVFANLLNSQVVVIDTYKGRTQGGIEITDGGKSKEKLRYNSVMALNPGEYKVGLLDRHHKTRATERLIALNRQSYVIMRVGVESQRGQSYPEEIVTYPYSDPVLLGASSRSSVTIGVLMTILASITLC